MKIKTLGIIGAGAWGTALATVAARSGLDVLVWAYEDEVVKTINEAHENTLFLPDVALDPAIRATGDLAAMGGCDALFLVTPAQLVRRVTGELSAHVKAHMPVAICAKGIEQDTGKLMAQIVAETMPEADAYILSGPSFAADVARNLPTAVTLAGADEAEVTAFGEAFGNRTFRPYFSDDIIGAQIGGAVKNVVAIACGIVEGKGFGTSARAAVTARGFGELSRLGVALGGRAETMAGLSGLGDLILTCTSAKSRNMSLGLALGEGKNLDDIMGARRSVAEGVHSAGIVTSLGTAHGLDLPICEAVRIITTGEASADAVIDDIMSRPFSREI